YSAFADFDRPHLLDRAQHGLFGVLAPKVLRDAEDHIRLLQQSSLDWTTVRAPSSNRDCSAVADEYDPRRRATLWVQARRINHAGRGRADVAYQSRQMRC